MKKFLLTLFIIVALAVGGVSYYFDTIIKRGVAVLGQRAQVEMRLDDVSLRGLNGVALKGFYVGNPQGFSKGGALMLGGVSVTVVPESLLSDTILVKEIAIDAPEITYEVNERGTNLGALSGAFSSVKGSGQESAEQGKAAEGGKKVIIEHLYVRKGKMNVAAGLAGQSAGAAVPFPDLHLTDIGKDSGGATTAQVAAYLMSVVVQTAALVNAEALKGAVEGITGDVEGTVKGLEQGAEGVKKQIEGLKDLF